MRRSADATGKCAKRRNSVKRDNVVGEFAVDRNSTPADNWSGAGLRPVPAARVDPGRRRLHAFRLVAGFGGPVAHVAIREERLCGHHVALALLDELEPGRITANLVAVHLLQRAGSRVEPEGEQPPGR